MKYPDIDPIALSIFGQINIHWYALTYLAAFFLCWRIMKATLGTGDRAWSDQQISDLLSAGMVGVILGGRIGYVLFTDLMPLSVIRLCCSGFGKGACLSMEDCLVSLPRCGCTPTGQGAGSSQ